MDGGSSDIAPLAAELGLDPGEIRALQVLERSQDMAGLLAAAVAALHRSKHGGPDRVPV